MNINWKKENEYSLVKNDWFHEQFYFIWLLNIEYEVELNGGIFKGKCVGIKFSMKRKNLIYSIE